jgi:hypothetical protein
MKHRQGIINGILAGVLTVGYFLLFYFIDRALLLNPWVWWGSLTLFLLFMFRVVRQIDSTTFRLNLQSAFLVFVIANAIFYLFYYLLFSVFDTGLVDLQREMLSENPLWQGGNTEIDLSVTIGRVIFSFAYSLIGGFILALLVSAVSRK